MAFGSHRDGSRLGILLVPTTHGTTRTPLSTPSAGITSCSNQSTYPTRSTTITPHTSITSIFATLTSLFATNGRFWHMPDCRRLCQELRISFSPLLD